MASNFELECTSVLNGGRMDENGKCTIVKQFLYNIRDNSKSRRNDAIFELEKLVPRKGSCMSNDARYVMKSAEWNCLNWKGQSRKFYINATYQRASDDEESSAPWNLSPFNISADAVEEAIAFKMAYDKDNERKVNVRNTAGDPIEANTNEILPQFTFSYYVQHFDASKVYEFANSVNAAGQRILGKNYPAGSLLLASINCESLVTYEDDGYSVKWKYNQINLTIRHNPNGWKRKLLNVGNRARFGSSLKSELIYQYYAPIYPSSGSEISFNDVPTLTNAQGYYAADREYRQWLAQHTDASGCPAQIPFEYAEDIPLTASGKIATSIVFADEPVPYPELEFDEYKTKNWRSLDIPSEIKRSWR